MSNKESKIGLDNAAIYVWNGGEITELKPIGDVEVIEEENDDDDDEVIYTNEPFSATLTVNDTKFVVTNEPFEFASWNYRLNWVKIMETIVWNFWLVLYSYIDLIQSSHWLLQIFGWFIIVLVAANIMIGIVFFDKRDWMVLRKWKK